MVALGGHDERCSVVDLSTFSARSKLQLETCVEPIQRVFNRVIVYRDCRILEGHRTAERQQAAYEKGLSQKQWPDSSHNDKPARAVDAAPWPIDWNDRDRFHYFAGFVLGIAAEMEVPLRWGGDWDRDGRTKDNVFDDLVHFEMVTGVPA